MGKVYCIVCQKRCKGDVLKIEQLFVHHKCFQCSRCQKNLKQGGFFLKDKVLYCPEDYQNVFGVKCEACNGFVEGEVVTVLGRTFHTHCFCCTACKHHFTSGERTTILNNSYYCVSCASRLTFGLEYQKAFDTTSSPKCVTSGLSVSGSKNLKTEIITPSESQTLPSSFDHNGMSGEQTFTSNTTRSYTPMNGQLSVEIHENGCHSSDSEGNKLKLEASGLEPVTVDTLLSTTPGPTLSAGSFTPSAIERRICPPGVDYGRQYPISYLQLAEQGFTAIMSSDELTSDSSKTREGRSRTHLSRSTGSPTSGHCKHLSRLDKAHSMSHRVSPTSYHPPPPPHQHHHHHHQHYHHSHHQQPQQSIVNQNGIDTQSSQLNNSIPTTTRTTECLNANKQSTQFNMTSQPTTVAASTITGTAATTNRSQIFPNASFLSYVDSIHTPASIAGRPKRDFYIRSRQLSPGSTSLGSGLMGYRHCCDSNLNSFGTQSNKTTLRDRYSYRSTPNVVGKRGMIQLAESLSCPRRDRTMSPTSASLYWSEARRLASYPNARIPDINALPAIERYDFPAPPSPAVVMIDRLREKRMTGTTDMSTITKDGTLTNATLSSIDTSDATLDRNPGLTAKLDRIDAEIETLKRLGESSGITAALIQEFQASKLQHVREANLDPVSASRSPNANVQPNYKTRYERHDFASLSRDTRRDRHVGHNLSYPMEYSSTGGRSGTIPSFSSALRYGHHTPSAHYGRAVSLPRPYMSIDENVDTSPTPIGPPGVRNSISTTLQTSQLSNQPRDHSIYQMNGMVNGPHRAVTGSKSFSPNFVGLRDGISSFTTSGLSMCGLTSGSGDDLTLQSPTTGYFLKSGTLTGLPHSVTGLRPTGRLTGYSTLLQQYQNYQQQQLLQHKQQQEHQQQQTKSVTDHSRTSTPVPSGISCMTDMDFEMEQFPTVQSYLRPSVKDAKSFKTYSYETLKKSFKKPIKGIDPTRLECYLDQDEFQLLFNMSMKSFQRLPEWKRNDLKKKIDLL